MTKFCFKCVFVSCMQKFITASMTDTNRNKLLNVWAKFDRRRNEHCLTKGAHVEHLQYAPETYRHTTHQRDMRPKSCDRTQLNRFFLVIKEKLSHVSLFFCSMSHWCVSRLREWYASFRASPIFVRRILANKQYLKSN